MKSILVLILTFSISFLTAQENSSVVNNTAQSLLRAGDSNQGSFSGATYFVNPSRDIKGSIYLFDTWDNYSVIYLDDNQRLILNNVNINMQRNSFDSKISQDSIFTFNTNNIVKFIINNKVYKNLYSEDGKRIYEIIYEEEGNFTILKGFGIKLIQGSANPMVNRKDDKFAKTETYFLSQGTSTIKPFRLSKKKVLGLISDNQDRVAKLEKFMKNNNLSYKKSEDIKKGMEYISIN